jgi:hypothetical protein
MFRSGMSEHQVSSKGMVDVVVPGELGLLCVCIYIVHLMWKEL